MQVSAPAKINLSLRILDRRPDEFHEIETVIARISLWDQLTIEKQQRWIDFQCDDPSIPIGDDNLVIRAAKEFFAQTNQKGGVSIALKKKIPAGAGLGGGSSDAAATLLALNELFSTNLTRTTLAELGARIGSDVAFFVFESAATCRGRGELVTPQSLARSFSLLLFKPEFGVPSAWAYSRWKHAREIGDVTYSPQKFAGQIFFNDLERPVFGKFVFLAQMKSWLLRQDEVAVALMSGSGSTIFAALKNGQNPESLADRARQQLDPKLWTYACHTLIGSSSPLLDVKNNTPSAPN
jgi:4-diphosphocytidyl-2-C-methyl-D-erythritol kinase